MEESFEMFEEELELTRQEAPAPKSVRQVRRPEMYPGRRMKEETPPATIQQVPKTGPREPNQAPVRTMSLRKSLSISNLSRADAPWENVTLNRCLFVAIAILVLSSAVQRLHEAVRGRRGGAEEEEGPGAGQGLTVRRSALRSKAPAQEPETHLWDVLFWWLPDFGDKDDGGRRRGKSGARQKGPGGARNRRPPQGRLTREGGGRLRDRRDKRDRDGETKAQKGQLAKPREEEEEEEEEEEDVVIPKKMKSRAPKS